MRQRGERLERPFAHLYETGPLRRVHLRGHPNILKRVLVHTGGFNLGLLMRRLTGVGTPRSRQGRAAALRGALIDRLHRLWRLLLKQSPSDPLESSCDALVTWRFEHQPIDLRTGVFTTGC